MSIFDINGKPLKQVYHVSGISIDASYNLDGEVVFQPCDIVVMTYNVQHFDGINSQEELQEKIVTKWQPDIIGLQEMPNQSPLPSIAQNMLEGYNVYSITALALASKQTISNVTEYEFTNQDPQEIERWGGSRRYIKGYANIKNKNVCVISTHLAVLNSEYTIAQMMELLDVVENEPYFILIGDFNFPGLAVRDPIYNSMYKPFIDAGYHLANCADDSDFNKTFGNATVATEQINLGTCPDNIITSGNIDILTTAYDLTKFEYLNGDVIDHIPVVSYLKIN